VPTGTGTLGRRATRLIPLDQAVDGPLFSISCTTCQASLKVRSEAAIGAILACPKCGSMVHVVPPRGWKQQSEPAEKKPGEHEPSPGEAPGPVEAESAADRPAPRTPEQPNTRQTSAAEAPTPEPAGRGKATPPPLPKSAGPPRLRPPRPPSEMTEEPGERVTADAGDSGSWRRSAAAVAPAELVWRKWLWLAAGPAAGLVIVVAGWSILSSRGRPEPPAAAIETQQGPAPNLEPVPPEAQPEPIPARVDRRWLPEDTKLLLSLQLSELAGLEEFSRAVALCDPFWRSAVGRVLDTFGVRPKAVRRLTWASTHLGDWADDAVVLIELDEGQDAGALRVLGDRLDFEVDGAECRRLKDAGWPHPFAILDERTIVTAEEGLLRRLADRSGDHLETGPVRRFLQAATPEAELLFVVDLGAAREAGWRLPSWVMDVWPPGREAWHIAWETPQGLGLAYRRGEPVFSELALICEGETAANQVHASLEELLPAAKASLGAEVESLTEKLQSGRITAEIADQYELLLEQGQAACDAARCEVVDETVWVRVDWGPNLSAVVAAGLDSQPAIRDDWLHAARVADEANHRRLLAGLGGHLRSEGCFPAGAGGGRLLPPETRLSWIATMLPYYDRRDWHRQLQFGYAWNGPQNRPVTRQPLDMVVNPALGPSATEAGFPVTHYVGLAGVGPDAGDLQPGDPRAGVFGFSRSARLEDIPDGASNTIAIIGVTKRLGAWGAGGEATVRALSKRPYVNGPDGFGSGQPDGMLVGMADGSVRFVSEGIDPRVLEQLATASGGEGVTLAALNREPAVSPPTDAAPGVLPLPVALPIRDDNPRASIDEDGGPLVESPPAEPDQVEPETVEVNAEERLSRSIHRIELPGVPLAHAADLLAQLSGLPITFDLEAMTQLDVDLEAPVTLRLSETTAGEALEAVVSSRGLVYVVENNQLLVTGPQQHRNTLRLGRYTVSDLIGHQPESGDRLAALVETLVVPDSWEPAGGRGSIRVEEGALVVLQTGAVHYQVLTFCEKLRAARGLPLRSDHDPERFNLATRTGRGRAALDKPVTVNFFDPVPLARLVAELGQQTGARILVDWLALSAEGISPGVTATLKADNQPLSTALAGLLRPLGLAYRVVDAETLELTTRRAVNARLELEFYPVGDLISHEATLEHLIERIKAEVAGATWSDAGGSGVLAFDKPSGCLLALQSQPVQATLEAFLQTLRGQQ